MSFSMEDLLQNNSVESLKSIIHQFDLSSNEKRKELQGMVGSEYHQFVKSAKDVSQIFVKSDIVANRLKSLQSKKREISLSFKSLNGLTDSNKGNFHEASTVDMPLWNSLNVCDLDFLSYQLFAGVVGSAVKSWFIQTLLEDALRWIQLKTIWEDCNIIRMADAMSFILCSGKFFQQTDYKLQYTKLFTYFCRCAHEQISDQMKCFRLSSNLEDTSIAVVHILHAAIAIIYILFCKQFEFNGIEIFGLVAVRIAQLSDTVNISRQDCFMKFNCVQPYAKWLSDEMNWIRFSFQKVLSTINSAHLLSFLQQKMFSFCTNPILNLHFAADNTQSYNELLLEAINLSSFSSANNSVWLMAFKLPFMHQSERLIEISCNKILLKLISIVNSYASKLGITLLSADARINQHARTHQASQNEIYFLAHSVSQFLFNSLLQLQKEITIPGNFTDYLLISFKLNCLRLLGSFFAYLRHVLDKLFKIIQSDKSLPSIIPCVDFVQFVIKLMWMIRFEGTFSLFCGKLRKDILQRGFKVSLEQLYSAFEIADSDGDGRLSSFEVFEAIQALSSKDHKYDLLSVKRFMLLCNRLGLVNFSFEEFTLLFASKSCGNFLCPQKALWYSLWSLLLSCWKSFSLSHTQMKFNFEHYFINQGFNNKYVMKQATKTAITHKFNSPTQRVMIFQFLYALSVKMVNVATTADNFLFRIVNRYEITCAMMPKNSPLCQLSGFLFEYIKNQSLRELLSELSCEITIFNSLSNQHAENFAVEFYVLLYVVESFLHNDFGSDAVKTTLKALRIAIDSHLDEVTKDFLKDYLDENSIQGCGLLNPFCGRNVIDLVTPMDFVSFFSTGTYNIGHLEFLPVPIIE